jgi:hypothetical protein
MKLNLTVDLNANRIAALADQLPQQEFSRVKRLIDEQARSRFQNAMLSARREFRRCKLTRKDALHALSLARGKSK